MQVGADLDGEAAGDRFGFSVSLSADGSRLAAGGWYNDGNGTDAGHVRVFEWNGSTWVQVGADLDGEAAGDWFGYRVSLSADGSRLAAGGWYNDGNGTDAGHVRVFEWNASGGAWVKMGQDIDGEGPSDLLGAVSLSADGSRLAAGADLGGLGLDTGSVRVFDWNAGTGSWVQAGQTINGNHNGDKFGVSVSLSADGSRLAAGAWEHYANGLGPDTGHVRVFDWDAGAGAWVQAGPSINGEYAGPIGTTLGDLFGWSVSLSADGSRLAAGGTYLGNDGDGTDAGRVRVFKQAGESQSARHTDWDPAQPVRGTKVWVVSHGRVTSCLDPRGGR